MKIAIAVLCVLIGALAYFAATYQESLQDKIDKEWKGCPYLTYRVRVPWPTPPAKMEEIVKEADKPLFINGKEVVMTKRDQTVMSNAMMRKAYGHHE